MATGGPGLESLPASTALIQGVQNVQISGGLFNMAARDMHNHTHYHVQGPFNLQSVLDSVHNFRAIHVATLGKATPGTGLWIFQWESFLIWLDPEGILKLMWGSGMPGAGKTILSSIIINALETRAKASSSPICVCYIYCRYNDHAKASVRSFLEVLVKQTLERHPHCLPLFEQLYARHVREKSQPAEEELLDLLAQFTRQMAATFYILDALDEAPVEIHLDLIRTLASLNVKLFVTSRPLKAVQKHFLEAHTFPIRAQDEDIDLHITKEMSRSPELADILNRVDATMRDEIMASIKQKCDGMFLHASLQLVALRECTNIYEIKETIESFPPQIEDAYIRTWDRILHQGPKKVLLAKAVLVWVIFATRSMKTEELQQAVAATHNGHKVDPNRIVPEAMLIGVCRGLVTIEEESGVVRLVHYTAKDTLERLVLETFPHPHGILASVCMTRLTECGFQRAPASLGYARALEEVLLREPLLSYAYHSWASHARKSLSVEPFASHLQEFVQKCYSFPVLLYATQRFELLPGPFHVAAFFDLPISIAGAGSTRELNHPTKDVGATPLYLACLKNCEIATKELLSHPDVLVNAPTKRGRTPLIEGARNGGLENIKLPLGHIQTNVNQDDEDGWTALMFASERGHENAVELLLHHHQINVNFADSRGRTPLMLASLHDREGVVKLLLAHPSANVNFQDKDGWTALIFALRLQSSESIVRLLLGHPLIDVVLADNIGRTPLMAAALSGSERAVQLALSCLRGDINQTDKDGRSALYHASREGLGMAVKALLAHPNIDVNLAANSIRLGWTPLMSVVAKKSAEEDRERTYAVKLLLDHPQVEVNRVDEQGRTALTLAAQHGAAATNVKLLLGHPQINVNMSDHDSVTALMRASLHGRAQIVQHLLAHPDINVNWQDDKGQTALTWASQNGHSSVVQVLLDHPQTDLSLFDKEGHTPLK